MKSIQLIVFICLGAGLISFLTPADTSRTLDSCNSPGTITFIGNAGADQLFTIESWAFTDVQMPDRDPTQLQLVAEMDMNSIHTDWDDLLTSVKKKKDYFFVRKFPTAFLSINGAEKIEDGRYQTEGTLQLKGITKTVPITFQISAEPPYHIVAEAIVPRRLFKFTGDGPANEVPVSVQAILPLN